MIIGSGGSGKSTLARQLGKILNIEVFHLYNSNKVHSMKIKFAL
jgi:adenylate kinase family enzyme